MTPRLRQTSPPDDIGGNYLNDIARDLEFITKNRNENPD